jgi:C1A family cysteine protease
VLHSYPLRKSDIDTRDIKFCAGSITKVKTVDMRSKFPVAFNQLSLGSCTANAGCTADAVALKNPGLILSRLFQYYNERELEKTINQDNGAQMRTICKALYKYGCCLEKTWPYEIGKYAVKPSAAAYAEALNYRCKFYHSLVTLNDIKTCLAGGVDRFVNTGENGCKLQDIAAAFDISINDLRKKNPQIGNITDLKPNSNILIPASANKGAPVLIGIEVYESFESDFVTQTGAVPMPEKGEEYYGGHAVLVVGFCDADVADKTKLFPGSKGYLIVRNSWGPDWGDHGYFYLPYEYITTGRAWDFWTLC